MADKIVEQEDEGRYGYGTTPAVNTMFKRLREKKVQSACLIAINLETLVRNTNDGKLKVNEIIDKVCGYMVNITSDFAQIVDGWPCKNHVIYYYCEPTVVPPLFQRVHKGPTSMTTKEALGGLIRRLSQSKTQTRGNVTSMICTGTLKQPSYKGLVDVFNRVSDKSVPVNMISHCAIDYHIERLGRIGALYRSYTGVSVDMTPANLGAVVFGDKNIPFYPVTHALLGDNSFIKPLLVKGDKENFVQLALREKFILRSESFIRTNKKINTSIIPYRLD